MDDATSKLFRVLIVDDHPLIQRGLRQLLGGHPTFEVCGEASDAAKAREMTEHLQPHLVMLDISLGSHNGLSLIPDLKDAREDVRILVLSAHAEATYAERAIRAGAHGYLNKAAPADQLLTAARRVAAGKIYLSDELADRVFHSAAQGLSAIGSPADLLSDREIEIFRMIGQGQTTREIAKALNRSIKTIETHREAIKSKLGLKDAPELSYEAIRWVALNP